MPSPQLPASGVKLTRTNYAAPVKAFLDDQLEPAVSTNATNVAALQTSVAAKYSKPSGGIPLTDLSASAQGSLAGDLVSVEQAGNYTLQPADWSKRQVFTGSAPHVLTVPANLLAEKVYEFVQMGSGSVTVQAAATGGTVAVRSSSPYNSGAATGTTAHNLVMPTVVAGDGLLTILSIASAAITVTAPADMQLVGTRVGPSGHAQFLYQKPNAPLSDSAAAKTFTVSTGTPMVAVSLSLSGAHPTDLIDGVLPLGPDSTNPTVSPTYVTQAPGCLELAVRSRSTAATQNTAPTMPATLTLLDSAVTANAGPNSQVAVSRGAAPVAAGTTIGGHTYGATGAGAVRTIAVRPSLVDSFPLVGLRRRTAEAGSFAAIVVMPQGVVVTGDLVEAQ